MRLTVTAMFLALSACAFAGCSSPASSEQLEKMCDKSLDLNGTLRGTSEEEEVGRVEEEYARKEKDLKDEMARDLKGLDDVLAAALEDLKAEEIELTEEEAEAGKTPEEVREERIAAKKADIDKKKQPIIEQFERLIEVLGPQKKVQVKKAKEYAAKRRKEADEARAECVSDSEAKGVSGDLAVCRIGAGTQDEYDACK